MKDKIKNLKKNWTRIEFENTPIYINPFKPDWFVPNRKADEIFKQIITLKNENPTLDYGNCEDGIYNNFDKFQILQLLNSVNDEAVEHYRGRAQYLKLSGIKELWLHLTNKCNLSCKHCMFSSGPASKETLSPGFVRDIIKQSYEMGCRLFYFTGGEPFVFPEFMDICEQILTLKQTKVIVLTNGIDLSPLWERLDRVPLDRFHLQISIDGDEKNHNYIRGRNSYNRLISNLSKLKLNHINTTLSMTVNSNNLNSMQHVVEEASMYDIGNIHFMWYFVIGKGKPDEFVSPKQIFPHLIKVHKEATKHGIQIDNVEIIKSQVFSPPGTRYDLSNAAWESAAIGPDGSLYPTPALISRNELATDLSNQSLDEAWKKSPTLCKIRSESVALGELYNEDPLTFIIGGGDIDHSYISSGKFIGFDPYVDIYKNIALWLIANEAKPYDRNDQPNIILRMGEKLGECSTVDDSGVALTHSNCVLAISDNNNYSLVKSFYNRAVVETIEDILNPVNYPEDKISHIPREALVRSFGCGSPVEEADIQKGEVVADLGSGTGIECFIASKLTGSEGTVWGIDMSEKMLNIACKWQKKVIENLGYNNIHFKKGYLEAISLEDNSCDVVISNCVLNLSPDKRRTFNEIRRILRDGGRMIVSDVLAEKEVPASIKHNDTLRGQCIAGALTEKHLYYILRETGFKYIKVLKRFFYREVQGYKFYSITFRAMKEDKTKEMVVIYRGPFAGIVRDNGQFIPRGIPTKLNANESIKNEDSLFVLDGDGQITNIKMESKCACFVPPEAREKTNQNSSISDQSISTCCENPNVEVKKAYNRSVSLIKDEKDAHNLPIRHKSDCMVCGNPLIYMGHAKMLNCFYCGKNILSNVHCEQGHFVCDDCHVHEGIEVIKHVCTTTNETEMLSLFKKIHNHASIPIHGPEHHAMVPGIILATYRNLGGNITKEDINTGIERGKTIVGGACAFMGVCGAASGVGTAFSVILKSNPLLGSLRKIIQNVTNDILSIIGSLDAARCCQRDCVLALLRAAELSKKYLPITLKIGEPFACDQFTRNRECINSECILWPENISNNQEQQILELLSLKRNSKEVE